MKPELTNCGVCGAWGSVTEALVPSYTQLSLEIPVEIIDSVIRTSCNACGAIGFQIPDQEELLAALAQLVIQKRSRLLGREILFLRRYMAMKAQDLGAIIGVRHETVSRWENGHEKIGFSSDKLLRISVFDNIHNRGCQLMDNCDLSNILRLNIVNGAAAPAIDNPIRLMRINFKDGGQTMDATWRQFVRY